MQEESKGQPSSTNAGENPKQPEPNPNEELVRVFDTEQESEAMVVNGLLESAGIQSDMTSLDAPQDILPGVGGTVILVRQEDAAGARQIIQESKRAAEEDTAEVDIRDQKISNPKTSDQNIDGQKRRP